MRTLFFVFFGLMVREAICSNDWLQKEVATQIQSHFKVLPQKAIPFSKYDLPSLYFPSTSSIEFIEASSLGGYLDSQEQKPLSPHTKVVLNPHLWLQESSFPATRNYWTVSAYSYTAGLSTNFKIDDESPEMMFDQFKDKVVIIAFNSRFYSILIMKLEGRERFFHARSYNQLVIPANFDGYPLSLCFHSNDPAWLFSIVSLPRGKNLGLSDPQDCIFFTIQNGELITQNIEIPRSVSCIKRHEYMGLNTIAFLSQDQFFFGWPKENVMILAKQSFSIGNCQPGANERSYHYLIPVTFSVNQDVDKRMPNGMARYIALLANRKNGANKELEQIVYILDLRNPYNALKRIFSCSSGPDIEYDRVSFSQNTISLWKDKKDSKNALQIDLPPTWIDDCERSLILKKFGKEAFIEKLKKNQALQSQVMLMFDNLDLHLRHKTVKRRRVYIFYAACFLIIFALFPVLKNSVEYLFTKMNTLIE